MYKFGLSKSGEKGFEKAARWAFFPDGSFLLPNKPEYYESMCLVVKKACASHTIDCLNYHIVKQIASLSLSIMCYEQKCDFDVLQFVAEVGCDGDNVRLSHV